MMMMPPASPLAPPPAPALSHLPPCAFVVHFVATRPQNAAAAIVVEMSFCLQ